MHSRLRATAEEGSASEESATADPLLLPFLAEEITVIAEEGIMAKAGDEITVMTGEETTAAGRSSGGKIEETIDAMVAFIDRIQAAADAMIGEKGVIAAAAAVAFRDIIQAGAMVADEETIIVERGHAIAERTIATAIMTAGGIREGITAEIAIR